MLSGRGAMAGNSWVLLRIVGASPYFNRFILSILICWSDPQAGLSGYGLTTITRLP